VTIASSHEVGGLARGIVGAARVIAFGTSIMAPGAQRPASLQALGQVSLPDEELASQDRIG
jgi:hypothetical protein